MDDHTSNSSRLLTLTRFGIYLLLLTPLVFWEPLYFFYDSTKSYFILAVSQVTLLLFVWLIHKQPEWRPQLTGIGKALLAFVVILLFTSLIGIDPSFSFWGGVDRITGGMMWLHLLAIFFVASSVFRSKRDWQRLFLVSTMIGLMLAAFHLLSLAGVELLFEARGGSTIGNSSYFGTYLLFQIGFALYLSLEGAACKMRVYGQVAFTVLAITLFLTSAQAAIGAVFVGAGLLFPLMLLKNGKTESKKRIGAALMAMFGTAAFIVTILLFQEGSAINLMFISLTGESRFALWNMAWQGFMERPILGWGLESFQFVSLEFYDSCFGSQVCGFDIWYDRAHSKMLDVLIEAGIVGLISYAVIFIVAIRAVWKRFETGPIPAIVIALLAAYTAQNLVGLDLAQTLLFWILLLAFISSITTPDADKQHRYIPMALPLIITIIFPLTFFYFVIQPIRGNLGVRASIVAPSFESHIESLNDALFISQVGLDDRRTYLAFQSAGLMWKTTPERMEPIRESAHVELDLIKEALLDTLEHAPNYLRAQLKLGLLYQTEARFFDPESFALAEKVLSASIERNPNNQQPYWALASVMLEQGKIQEGFALTQAALALDRRVIDGHLHRMIAALFTRDEEFIARVASDSIAQLPELEDRIMALSALDLSENALSLLFELH
jgi:O-antigen ligase